MYESNDPGLQWTLDLRRRNCRPGRDRSQGDSKAGHKTIAMTSRYAHLSHTTLQNPLAVLNGRVVVVEDRKNGQLVSQFEAVCDRKDSLWNQVEAYIQKRQPKNYDRAVILLTDQRDLAIHHGQESEFQSVMASLRKIH